MSVTPEQEQAQLDALAIAIRQRAEQAFEAMLQRLREGESPRDAIKAVSETFAGEYFSELSTAFSAVLQENVGLATIKAWPVGEVDLSERLYTHLDEVNAVTRGLIADHVKGFVQARTLAMQIYEGYEFKTDPLQVKAKLPKYLREALDDPAVSQGFAQIVGRIRASALKTPALKAAYLQAIDDLEAGVGEGRLRRVTRVAWYERNRYFANRIAQTELHRAYSNQVSSELMSDDEAVWVKVQMSRTHPRVDICDYHSGLNAWGQGPGFYPKAKAPRPPFHPFCRCTVRPAYELDAEAEQVERQDAPQAFMQGRSDYDQRLIAGSRDRLQRFRDGESLEAIYNGATKSTYRWGRVGDGYNATTQEISKPAIEDAPAWKEGTAQAAWHEKSFKDANEAIIKGIRAHDHRLNDVEASSKEGAFYSSSAKKIQMGKKTMDTYHGQGVFRHEYGHFLDNVIAEKDGAGVGFRSSYPDFITAMKDDMKDSLRSSGMGRPSAATTAFNNDRAMFYNNAQSEVVALEKSARKAVIAVNARSVGLTYDEVVSFIEKETTHIDDILARDVRINRMLVAIQRSDPLEFMEAIHSGIDWREKSYIYKKGIIGKFSDLIGSATKNRLLGHGEGGNGGHSKSYYAQGAEFAPTEVFANLTALVGSGDKVWVTVLERMTPRLLKKYTEIMNEQ